MLKDNIGNHLLKAHLDNLFVFVSGKITVGVKFCASSTVIMPYAITIITSPGWQRLAAGPLRQTWPVPLSPTIWCKSRYALRC